MFLNELIGTAKQLAKFVEDYERLRCEIKLWRIHYLDSLVKYDRLDKDAFVRSAFMRTPSSAILEKGLEKVLKEIEDDYDNIYGQLGEKSWKEDLEKKHQSNKIIDLHEKS